MSISHATTAGAAFLPAWSDGEKGTLGGVAQPVREGLRFADLLDAISPVSIVSSVYHSLVGGAPAPAAPIAGAQPTAASTLPATEEASSKLATVSAESASPWKVLSDTVAAEPAKAKSLARATAAAAPATPSPAPTSVTAAASPATPKVAATPVIAGAQSPGRSTGKDIRAYFAQALPARATAPAPAAAVPSAKAAPATPEKPPAIAPKQTSSAEVVAAGRPDATGFADRMLSGLEKYRAQIGAQPASTQKLDQQS